MSVCTAAATTSMSNNLDFESNTLCITAPDIPSNDDMSFDVIALPDYGPILFVDRDFEPDIEIVDILCHAIRDTSNMEATVIIDDDDDNMPAQQRRPMHLVALIHSVGSLIMNSLTLMARGIMWVPQACQRVLPRLVTSTNNSHRHHPVCSHTVPTLVNAQHMEDASKNQDSDYAIVGEVVISVE
jgi:hypothetical protein